MSLVGPRPERLEFVEALKEKIPYFPLRHVVKPGITGWAQMNYGYGSSEKDAVEELQHDFYYIQHMSLLFDIYILIRTIPVVLFGLGAR
jgi:lipopolysaccharide/colanic/teichoic acid biosynthesis glycosyltransferase